MQKQTFWCESFQKRCALQLVGVRCTTVALLEELIEINQRWRSWKPSKPQRACWNLESWAHPQVSVPEARAHVLDGSMLGGSLFWDASLDLKPSLGFGGERSAMLIGTKVTSKSANPLGLRSFYAWSGFIYHSLTWSWLLYKVATRIFS